MRRVEHLLYIAAADRITTRINTNVQSPMLVVELNLDRIEGTQLRALGLLAVYGFNVTYEVRAAAQAPGPTSCSAIECRLLGHCYASHDYQMAYEHMDYLMVSNRRRPWTPATKKELRERCRPFKDWDFGTGKGLGQMGQATVSCICALGYTGDLCEAQVAPPDLTYIPTTRSVGGVILHTYLYGVRSPYITFTWYKDGVQINFNGNGTTTRDIWTRTAVEDALGRRLSVLGVTEAERLDSGKWSGAADDAGRRRCRALRLTVLRPPEIHLVPSTLTVNKGDNVSITCLAGTARVHGAAGFSWAKERTLLPMVDSYRGLGGFISSRQCAKALQCTEFQCVSLSSASVAGTNAKAVTMWALGTGNVACENETSHGIRWPRTAPGAHATSSCPAGYSGYNKKLSVYLETILYFFISCFADEPQAAARQTRDSCKICTQSTPDEVNTVPRPIKSCLKKRSHQLSWSTSLPSIHHESNEQNNSHLQLVDTQSQTPSTHTTFTQTDKVLHKISHDLDFLLNRTPSRVADNCPQQIEEAPT
ncbi:unnamed protein product [Spodoptera exigua]|nr:unnamed protein product [Spodoptera exigua]